MPSDAGGHSRHPQRLPPRLDRGARRQAHRHQRRLARRRRPHPGTWSTRRDRLRAVPDWPSACSRAGATTPSFSRASSRRAVGTRLGPEDPLRRRLSVTAARPFQPQTNGIIGDDETSRPRRGTRRTMNFAGCRRRRPSAARVLKEHRSPAGGLLPAGGRGGLALRRRRGWARPPPPGPRRIWRGNVRFRERGARNRLGGRPASVEL